jgi:hypothetical protein
LKRNLILSAALVVVAFFWIWLSEYTGAKAYWIALISFGIYIAAGAEPKKLPWMTLGAVTGVIGGFLTFALAMLVLPMYASISLAIAGTIFILIGAAISLAKFPEIFPFYILGWGGFLGAIGRFDYLFNELVVEAMPRALSTFFGVLLSVLFGLLLGALLGTPILKLGKKETAVGAEEVAKMEPTIEQGVS